MPISLWEPLAVVAVLALLVVGFACAQDYPVFELLLGAEDQGDPALELGRRLQREHPGVAISVVICAGMRGRNPKVRVLRGLAPRARYQHLLISDSNVRPAPGYLRATAAELRDPDVGMVTNPIIGIAPNGRTGEKTETLGALFENPAPRPAAGALRRLLDPAQGSDDRRGLAGGAGEADPVVAWAPAPDRAQ